MWQLFCNPFYSTMSAAGWNLQARNSFGTFMQPDYVWNTLPWQLMPQSWGMYLQDAFSMFYNRGSNNNNNLYGNNFTPGASIYNTPSYMHKQGDLRSRVSDPALDTDQSTEDLAKDILDKEKYENNYKKLDSILKLLKDSTNPANLSDDKQCYIKAVYFKMNNYTTTKDRYEALKACYDELVKDNDTKTKIQNYLLSTKAKLKFDNKEIGAQLKSIGLGMTKQEDNAIAKNLPDKIKNCNSEADITNLLDGVTADNILEVMSACEHATSLTITIANKFDDDIKKDCVTKESTAYRANVMRKMQTLMQKRAGQVLANSDIKDEEKTKIQNLVDKIEDCTGDASKYNPYNLNKLYIVLRQTEARILEDKLKKEYACLGESGLEINLVEKTNEDLKSEGFTIDVDTEVEATKERNQKKMK